MEAPDSLDTRQSKQRASIKWLLSKAFNNRVPENLQEPFYRDHEEQEHLKPPIVGGLANAELYCLALANMYSDPNYHNLNHWNILQTLARKGVHVPDPPDAALTETVLIQTNPIRMGAHMAVIEAIMVLYAREVVTLDRVSAATQRFGVSQPVSVSSTVPHEDGLLCWINAACSALNRAESEEPSSQVATVTNLQELCDGTALAALISFYCPDALPRSSVRVGRVSSLQDCLHNLMLVLDFCQRFLPHNVFHMLPEDVTYMRGSMRQNLIAMLADLFNMLEVHPVKCVKYPGSACGRGSNEHGIKHKRCLPPPPPVPIPDLRANLDPDQHSPFTVARSPSGTAVAARTRGVTSAAQRSACSTPERRSASPHRAQEHHQEEFVVHRGKGVTTLSSMARQPDDRGVPEASVPAGRPSNWEDTRGASYAGRRSRRSSISDDSQLTVENFGGSQDRLNFCGRNPEKELATVGGNYNNSIRKISAPAGPVEPAVPVRSLKQDSRGSLQFMYDDYSNGTEPTERQQTNKTLERQFSQPQTNNQPEQQHHNKMRRQLSSDTITLNKQSYSNKGGGDGGFYLNNRDATDGDISNKMASFADMNRFRNGDQSGIQMMYSDQNELEDTQVAQRKKSTTFATLPNTTTWQQQSMQHDHHPNGAGDQTEDVSQGSAGGAMATQLNNIRMKLEEKRRHIEQDKRRMELSMNRQRQQVGQQAFLQAVTRSKAGGKTPSEDPVTSSPALVSAPAPAETASRTTAQPFTLQDMNSEVQSVENKWLDGDSGSPFTETRRTPDLDGMGLEEYQQTIAKLNSNLHDLHTDIARIQSQQSQLQANQLFQQHPPPQQQLQQQQPPQQQQQQAQHNIPQLHNQYSSQHNVSSVRHGPSLHNPNFGSTPHIPHNYQDSYSPRVDYARQQDQSSAHQEQGYQQYGQEQTYGQSPRQFYLHDNPAPLPRRTWAQHAQSHDADQRGWQLHQQNHQQQQQNHQQQPQNQHYQQQQNHQYQQPFHEPQRTWKSPSPQPPVQETRTWNPQSFVLHERTNQQPAFPVHYNNTPDRYQNGNEAQNHLSYTVINPNPAHHHAPSSPPPLSSPQRRAQTPQRQGSLTENIRRAESVSLQQLSNAHAPVAAPPSDDMEPQNISFIGNAEDDALHQGINRLNISSGTRTYRIPSPTRPSLNRNSFQQPVHESSHSEESAEGGETTEKGFYISFDNEPPKRPKPPLRAKKMSPRKERTEFHSPERESPESRSPWQERVQVPVEEQFVVHRNVPSQSVKSIDVSSYNREMPPRDRRNNVEPAAIVIQENVDPNSAEEMEKKKERIMLLCLQRRQRAEEARARAEAAAATRRERDEQVAEERAAKKEEQARRREAILQQYKMKKAIEEAEREGKVIDKAELMAAMRPHGAQPSAPAPKLRGKGAGGARARPKTIHVDSGALEAAEGMLGRKQGSSTNLTAYGSDRAGGSGMSGGATMRRDYYRGSQDSLADRARLYAESPVEESRGVSPGSGSTSALGRRGSYKTSRERVNEVEPQAPVRGRTKYSTYQNNFKAGRKSSSLMNLCDSGLGRATPPRRAASPGVRQLTSPAGSGPGSLPGGIGKRTARHGDDGASDVSSTHSSIMDYSGPRLYKQPATKSNRGIMLNAVEYCVFPGVVNREAKRRVLEEIARSESKHFLVLFRDAGCQFRALYSYCPDTENVTKLYGTGPKSVNDRMFDKFFKYNSGSKCFSQIHTKHLTVTIDAFTIHNSLWQGKKVQHPSKKDMALVI